MKGSELTVAAKGNKVIVSALREVAIGNVVFELIPVLEILSNKSKRILINKPV